MSYGISEELQNWVIWPSLEQILEGMENKGIHYQLKNGAPEYIKKEFEEWKKYEEEKYNELLLGIWLLHDYPDDFHVISLKEGAPEDVKKLYEEFKKQDFSKITKQKIIVK